MIPASDEGAAAFFDNRRPKRGLTMVAIEDIEPNPYRKMDYYDLREEKLEALAQSFDSTGYWDGSLQARPHPTKAGKVELCFGHHRLEAAKRKGMKALGLMVEERSNADMLRMMADENRSEFTHDPLVAVETITAVIEAFGRREIELPPVPEKTNKAHIFHAAPGGAAYTASTVARFLRWVKQHGNNRDPQPTRGFMRAFRAHREGQPSPAVTAYGPPGHGDEVLRPDGASRTGRSLATARKKKAEAKVRMAAHQGVRVLEEVTEDDTRWVVHQLEYHYLAGGVWDQCRRLTPHLSSQSPESVRTLADALEHLGARFAERTQHLAAALRASDFTQFAKLLEEDRTEDDAETAGRTQPA